MNEATAMQKNFHDPFDHYIRELPVPDAEIKGLRVRINRGTIKSIAPLTHDTLELVVKCDPGSQPLDGVAGQFATLKVPGIRKSRSYSFAKTPEDEKPDEHTFYIRLVPGGELSGWLAQEDRIGEQVEVTGPLGTFQLDASDDTMVCIAGGSGMSAIAAIVKHAANLGVARDCYFFYGARTQKDLYCLEEMQAVRDRWNPAHRFEFIPVLSEEPEGSDWDGPRGLVTTHVQNEYLDPGKLPARGIKVYFCGPPPMIDHGVELLTGAGLGGENIYFDKFEDASSPAPVVDNTKCVLCDECLLVKPVANCLVEATNFKTNGDDSAFSFEQVRPAHTSGLYYNSLYIDESECVRCFACVDACPHDAISVDYDRIPKTLRMYT